MIQYKFDVYKCNHLTDIIKYLERFMELKPNATIVSVSHSHEPGVYYSLLITYY